MHLIWDGLREAVELLARGDDVVLSTAARSLYVSGLATLLSLAFGVALGAFLAFQRFPGRNIAMAFVNTGMGLPPVVVGLVVAIVLWRSGPLGRMHLIYTPWAMILAQALLAFPIVTGFTAAALGSSRPELRLQLFGIGASMMVGGNIAGETRVLTTAVVLETSRGDFAPAIALSLILLALIFAVSLILTTVQLKER